MRDSEVPGVVGKDRKAVPTWGAARRMGYDVGTLRLVHATLARASGRATQAAAPKVYLPGASGPFPRPAFSETTGYRTAERDIHLFGGSIYTCSGVYFTLGR